jgi:ABC-type transport system substrate-binding protein
MGMHFFTPVAREAVEYYDGREERLPNGKKVKRPLFKNHPVGNGAFRFPPGESYEPGRGARLVRNENYRTLTFPGDALPPDRADWLRQFVGKPLPLVDELHLTVFQETTAMATLGRQGYLDSMGLQKDAFDVFVTSDRQLSPEFKQRGMTLAEDREPAVFWLMLNLEDPVLGPNKKLRQALAAAMDRDAYIEKFFNGIPLKAPQLLPPGIPGHEPGWKDPYDYNLEKARQLMVEAGYPGGRDPKTNAPLRISMDMIASSALERQMAQFQVQKMRDIGVELQVIENEFAPLINKQDSGNFQISSGSGWGADYPDAENFFALFHGPKVFPNGKNGSRYRNPEYDQCFEKMAVMENSPERTEIIHRMNHMLAEDVPVILLYYKRYFSVIAPWARRTHDNSMLEGGFKYAWIDAPMRDRLQREWNTPVLWPLWLVLFGCAVLGAYGIHLNRVRNV